MSEPTKYKKYTCTYKKIYFTCPICFNNLNLSNYNYHCISAKHMQANAFIKKYNTKYGYKLNELLDYFITISLQKCKILIQQGQDPSQEDIFSIQDEWNNLFKLFSNSNQEKITDT